MQLGYFENLSEFRFALHDSHGFRRKGNIIYFMATGNILWINFREQRISLLWPQPRSQGFSLEGRWEKPWERGCYDPIMLTGLTENLVQISENNAIYKWRTRKRKWNFPTEKEGMNSSCKTLWIEMKKKTWSKHYLFSYLSLVLLCYDLHNFSR